MRARILQHGTPGTKKRALTVTLPTSVLLPLQLSPLTLIPLNISIHFFLVMIIIHNNMLRKKQLISIIKFINLLL